jgi:NADH:ubiquinone oxidoreductase subunit E
MHQIEVCLGSSCFARGGSRYPEVVQEFLREHRLDAEVRGRRCAKACADGPKVAIDGNESRVATADELRALLARILLG